MSIFHELSFLLIAGSQLDSAPYSATSCNGLLPLSREETQAVLQPNGNQCLGKHANYKCVICVCFSSLVDKKHSLSMHSLLGCSIDPPKANLSLYCVWLWSRNRQRLDGLNQKYTAVVGPVRLADHFIRFSELLNDYVDIRIFKKLSCSRRRSLVKNARDRGCT